MNAPFDLKTLKNPFTAPALHSLAEVASRVSVSELPPARKRDLLSAIRRVGALLRQDPSLIPAEISVLRERLDNINPAAIGIAAHTLSNLRSNVFAALEAAGVGVLRTAKIATTPSWGKLLANVGRRYRDGLSRFARFCSSNGIQPEDVDDAVLYSFGGAVRASSFARKANTLQRDVATLWNRLVVLDPRRGLCGVTCPDRRKPSTRITLDALPASFGQDLAAHLEWAACDDPFAVGGRSRPLAPRSIRLRKEQVLTSVTALARAGMPIENIASLASIVTPDAFTSIMRQRLAKTRGRANTYDYGLAKALVVIAKEWVKPDARVVAELKPLLSRVPAPPAGLTPKNTALLGIFDNPEVLARLHALPSELMAEAEGAPRSLRSLAKAQAAVAIFVALYAPVRPSNLAALKLGETLFIGNRDDRESVVELPEEVVKNGDAFGTVLPPEVTTLLRRYRDHFLTPLLGREPTYLFDNGSGSPKLATTLSGLVQRTIYRRLGFKMGLHQFRHVGAKTLLDEDPSAHEAVRQLLGHKNMKTTTNFYAGLDTRRAARLHAKVIREILADNATLQPQGSRRQLQTRAFKLRSSKGRRRHE